MPEPTRAIVAHYDQRAATYDESAMHRGLTDAVADLLDLAGVATVLDVATGTGLMLRALARRRDGLRLVGVDLSPGMLEVAARELPEAALVLATASDLPVPDASVDLLTCITALHLFADPEAVLAEWARVVRPGGRAVTATFVPGPDQPPARRGGFPRNHGDYAHPELVADRLAPYGFALLRSCEWSDGQDTLLVCELARC